MKFVVFFISLSLVLFCIWVSVVILFYCCCC